MEALQESIDAASIDLAGSPKLHAILATLEAFEAGDRTARMPAHWSGVEGKIATVFNDIALRSVVLLDEVGRLEHSSGKAKSKLMRLADERLGGFWRDGIEAVELIGEKSAQLQHCIRTIHIGLTGLKKGDTTVRLPESWRDLFGKVAEVFNEVVERNVYMTDELARLSRVVGKEGKLKERAALSDASGFWRDSVDAINSLIGDLVHPTSEVARVIGAVAQGDLTKSMALEADGRALEGEFLRTAKIINKMVEQLCTFAAEVTRVAREVGT